MSRVNVVPYRRIEYVLEHADFDPVNLEVIPEGWETDDKEYERVEDYDGILTKFSNNLTFGGDGKDFILMILEIYGPDTTLILRRRERHPQTNKWRLAYIGYLDLFTYDIQDNKVKLKFNSSGLQNILKTRATKKIEIESLQTLDGKALPELKTEQVLFEGRRIFLKSVLGVSETNNTVTTSVESNAGNTRNETLALPLIINTNQHQVIAQAPYFQQKATELVGDIGMMFFLNMDRDRVFKFNIKSTLDAVFTQFENVQTCSFRLCLTIYKNGLNFDLKERIVLHELTSFLPNGDANKLPRDYDAAYPDFTKPMIGNYSNDALELKQGESVAFETLLIADMYTNNNAGVRVNASNLKIEEFIIEEDSVFDPSVSKCVMAHELGERLIQMITGRDDAFYSEALGRVDIGYDVDGVDTGALNGFSHGMWIRGFDKLPESQDNKYKAFTTSFKDFIDHKITTWNLAVGIEKIGLKERIRIEEKNFFYQGIVLIHVGHKDQSGKWIYPEVSNLKRNPAKKEFYSGLILGFEKGWENEEAMGLDEPNAQTEFATPITGNDNVFERISKYIGGSYPKEFIRRKPLSQFPTTDHPNDNEIFVHDLKKGVGVVYDERKWQDDFEEAPTGIFSPETATNLRLSVLNILLRQANNIASCMIKKVGQFIRYTSSKGNSSMTTKLIGGKAYTENGFGDTNEVIVKEDLGLATVFPELIEFEFKVDTDMIEQIEGSTEVLGKTIPNFYGLVQFRNDKGVLETGFLFNLKPNDKGQWKLLKANR